MSPERNRAESIWCGHQLSGDLRSAERLDHLSLLVVKALAAIDFR
jgi:hypothetical protein